MLWRSVFILFIYAYIARYPYCSNVWGLLEEKSMYCIFPFQFYGAQNIKYYHNVTYYVEVSRDVSEILILPSLIYYSPESPETVAHHCRGSRTCLLRATVAFYHPGKHRTFWNISQFSDHKKLQRSLVENISLMAAVRPLHFHSWKCWSTNVEASHCMIL